MRLLIAPGMLFLLLAGPAHAGADDAGWRFWGAADGLTEAYSTVISPLRGGRIAVRHGDVSAFEILDGFRVTAVPDRHWLGRRLYEDDSGALLTFNDQGIAAYRGKTWSFWPRPEIDGLANLKKFAFRVWYKYPTRPPGSDLKAAAVVPVAGGRLLLLADGKVFEWNRETGDARLIRTAEQTNLGELLNLEPAAPGSVWVMGKRGFGVLTLEPGSHTYSWKEIHPDLPGLTSYSDVRPYAGGIFVTAQSAGGTVAIGIEGMYARVLASATGKGARLWPGQAGRIWKTDGNSLGYVEGTKTVNLAPSPELAGQILDVLPENSGGFWLGMSKGLAHYTPPLWQEPPGAPAVTSVVSSIAEDSKGRIWFAAGNKLLLYQGDAWHEYLLPKGEEFRFADPQGLCPLPDGRILIDSASDEYHLVFDPNSERFKHYIRGEGLNLGLMLPRREGGMWVESYEPASRTYRFEILENGIYRGVPGLEELPMAEFRALLEARNGDIWVGTTRYLARLSQGKLRVLDATDGFRDSGAYSFLEDPDGSILIGGRDGITKWNGKTFGPLNREADRVRNLVRTPDGTRWGTSGAGVHRYQNGVWISNSTEEGLPGSGYGLLYDSRGRLWAGTSFGMRIYHPEADRDAPATRIPDDRNLRRTPPGGDVRLNFEAEDKWKSTPPHRILYSWSLDGATWSPFGSADFVSFHAVASGSHSFRVRSMDRNGNIDPGPAVFEFSVVRPWFQEPLFLLLLLVAVTALVALGRAVVQKHARLRFESRHDPLTGLMNRPAFETSLDRAIEDAGPQGRVCVMFLDLDGFKRVNDSLGHRVGDLLLISIGGALDSCVRQADPVWAGASLARLGGDEFGIVLPGGDTASAQRLADRILDEVRKCESVEGQPVRVSCSIGISMYPAHGSDPATLLRLADLAMYRGKAGSKDCCLIHDPAENRIDFRNSGMAVILREALENNHLYLLFQPVVNAAGAIVEFEALARIRHPERGQIPPAEFIPVAEETRMIVPLGRWVLREALRQARCWQKDSPGMRVAVNVSCIEMDEPDFAGRVLDCIDAAGVRPSILTLEITESALSRNWQLASRHIERLRARGVGIALDDFGTGYSSFSRLHALPVDRVKIDRSFVGAMALEPRSFDLVRDTIALAHRLGYSVVGEGVETADQMRDLQGMDCDQYQGFLLSQPVSGEDAMALLAGESLARDAESSPVAVG